MAETATGVHEQAQETAQQAQEKVHETAQKASGQARWLIEQGKNALGDRVTATAQNLRTIAQQLREQGNTSAAKMAEQAAERVEGIGSWVRETDATEILADVENAARRQPWALAVGGAALGLLAARMLKVSSAQRYERVPVHVSTGRTDYGIDDRGGVGDGESSIYGGRAAYAEPYEPPPFEPGPTPPEGV